MKLPGALRLPVLDSMPPVRGGNGGGVTPSKFSAQVPGVGVAVGGGGAGVGVGVGVPPPGVGVCVNPLVA